MNYKVKIDRQLCIGAANCTAIAPSTFELDGEGKSVIRKKDGTTTTDFVHSKDIVDDKDTVFAAAKVCPVNAIVIIEVDDDGKEIRQIWPV